MKFIVGNGELLKEKIENFPWSDYFLASRVLVLLVTDDNSVIGACGLRSIFDIRATYIKREYRGRGLGIKLQDVTTDAARRRGHHFIISCVFYPFKHRPHSHSVNPKSGFREVTRLKDPKIVIFMLPLTPLGKLAYYFLRTVFPMLPNVVLATIAQKTHDMTKIRRQYG
jgi:hypothetical protein